MDLDEELRGQAQRHQADTNESEPVSGNRLGGGLGQTNRFQ
jgi:hypothetical protein